MKIIKIISEWKKRPSPARMKNLGTDKFYSALPAGHKIFQAIVQFGDRERFTRHIAVPR